MYRVVIVEDDPGIRRFLETSVEQSSKLSLIGSACCLQDGKQLLSCEMPDVLLVDLGLPDGSGIDLIRLARASAKPVEIMVITIHADQHHLIQALEAGAKGYLLKDTISEDVESNILELMAGGSPISPLIARALLCRFDFADTDVEEVENLTERETEVLKAMMRGMTRKEIAFRFAVSIHTINSHVRHIYEKLEVNSNIGAVQKARRLNLISEIDG